MPLRNVRLTVMLPKGAHYVSGSGTLDEAHNSEPTVMDNMITFRLGDHAPNWSALLQFSASLDDTTVADESVVTKALLTVDTPEQKNARTPPIEVALLSHNVKTGQEHKHYVMRWQFDSMEAELNADAKQELDKLIQQLAGLSLNIRSLLIKRQLNFRLRSIMVLFICSGALNLSASSSFA